MNANSAKAWVKANPWTTALLAAIVTLAVTVTGCQPQTQSPWTGEKVTAHELESQAAQWEAETRAAIAAATTPEEIGRIENEAAVRAAALEAARSDLDQRRNAAAAILDTVGAVATPLAGAWGWVVPIAVGAIGVGLGLDNRKQHKRSKPATS